MNEIRKKRNVCGEAMLNDDKTRGERKKLHNCLYMTLSRMYVIHESSMFLSYCREMLWISLYICTCYRDCPRCKWSALRSGVKCRTLRYFKARTFPSYYRQPSLCFCFPIHDCRFFRSLPVQSFLLSKAYKNRYHDEHTTDHFTII